MCDMYEIKVLFPWIVSFFQFPTFTFPIRLLASSFRTRNYLLSPHRCIRARFSVHLLEITQLCIRVYAKLLILQVQQSNVYKALMPASHIHAHTAFRKSSNRDCVWCKLSVLNKEYRALSFCSFPRFHAHAYRTHIKVVHSDWQSSATIVHLWCVDDMWQSNLIYLLNATPCQLLCSQVVSNFSIANIARKHFLPVTPSLLYRISRALVKLVYDELRASNIFLIKTVHFDIVDWIVL